MLTILWDNDGVLVDTEGLYFRATQEVLRTVGIHLTANQFKEISLRRGESTFVVAADHGIADDEIARLRAEQDRRYAELLGSQSWTIDGAEEMGRYVHSAPASVAGCSAAYPGVRFGGCCLPYGRSTGCR